MRILLAGVLSLLLAASSLPAPVAADETDGVPDSVKVDAVDPAPDAVAEGLIVRYADGVEPVTASGEVTGGTEVDDMVLEPGEDIGFGLTTVEFDGEIDGDEAQRAADELAEAPGVIAAEPNYVVTVDSLPPGSQEQATQTSAPWGLDRIDQRSKSRDGKYFHDTTGAGVLAYVIDSGVRSTHSQFTGRIAPGFSVVGGSTEDCLGHGTHVAGILGGTSYGVAKKATIVPVRVFGCSDTGTIADIIAGVRWVIDDHQAGTPAVANMSLSGPQSFELDSAVEQLVADGVTVVAASGNDGDWACDYSPASVGAAIVVNASDSKDGDYLYSNFGECTDIYAPGVAIKSAWIGSNSATKTITGTSMAAPHVAGVAARILSSDPTLTPGQVAAIIDSNATTVNFGIGWGDPNKLLYAPRLLTTTPEPVVSGTAQVGQLLTASAGSWGSGVLRFYQWMRDGTPIDGQTATTYRITPADTGTQLAVMVSGERSGYLTSNRESVETPAVVGDPGIAEAVDSAEATTCALQSDSTVQCNDGATISTIAGLTDATSVSIDSAAGSGADWHGCALTASGTVKCWGSNAFGQLGDGTTTNRPNQAVLVLGIANAVAVDVGGYHSCAVIADGSVECWGGNGGLLGNGLSANSAAPVRVSDLAGVTAIGLADDFSCAALTTGEVKCWGINSSQRLGSVTTPANAVSLPILVPGVTGAVEVALDDRTACARLGSGEVMCWGGNAVGQLGNGTTANDSTPRLVPGLADVARIGMGHYHACAIITDGSVACWGTTYAIGQGETWTAYSPTPVAGVENASDLGLGLSSCVTLQDGRLECWGYNQYYQLLDGSTVSRGVPAATLAVGRALTIQPTPTVTGSVIQGNTLTATPGTWDAGATLAYQWFRNGDPLADEHGATYTTTPDDVGSRLVVTVTATKDGHRDAVRSSAPTAVIAPLRVFTSAPQPTISGTTAVGATLSARAGTWSPTATLRYQWMRGTTPIDGATNSTYRPTVDDLSLTVSVVVTATRADYTPTARQSAPTRPIQLGTMSPAPVPAIAGSRVGEQTLTAIPGSWAAGASLTYQWKRSGVPITDAVGPTYRLTPADVGRTISVSVTGQKPGYAPAMRTSAATSLIARPTVGRPTGISVTPSLDGLELSWVAPSTPAGVVIEDYVISYRLSTATKYTVLADGPSTATAAMITGLQRGKSYVIVIVARSQYGLGAASAPLTRSSLTGLATAPRSLVATPGIRSIDISWAAPESTNGGIISDYVVYYRLSTASNYSVFADGVSTATAATVTGLLPGKTYVVIVAARTDYGVGAKSGAISRKPAPA